MPCRCELDEGIGNCRRLSGWRRRRREGEEVKSRVVVEVDAPGGVRLRVGGEAAVLSAEDTCLQQGVTVAVAELSLRTSARVDAMVAMQRGLRQGADWLSCCARVEECWAA